jgi:hypothetical protein
MVVSWSSIRAGSLDSTFRVGHAVVAVFFKQGCTALWLRIPRGRHPRSLCKFKFRREKQ